MVVDELKEDTERAVRKSESVRMRGRLVLINQHMAVWC